MCIFSGKVDKVSDTKILVYETSDGKQVTFYENSVEPNKKVNSNAMILPCPYNGSDEIKLYNLEQYSNFFNDCSECFPKVLSADEDGGDLSFNRGASRSLEIVEVGGYKVSIAKNLDDVLKVDKSVFILPDNIAKILSKHYSKGFAFIICVFASKKIKSHPIAYEHSMLKNSELFVPTKHAHGGEKEAEQAKANFGHVIYSVNTKDIGVGTIAELERVKQLKEGPDLFVLFPRITPANVFDKLKNLNVKVPKAHLENTSLDLRKHSIQGMQKNDDLIYSLA